MKMKWFKSEETRNKETLEKVITLLQEEGLAIDAHGNIVDQEAGIVGSLNGNINFMFPPMHKDWPAVQTMRKIMRIVQRSPCNYGGWKPNV